MCGICGQYNFGDRAPVALRDVETMTRTIVHRGPDDEGYHVSGPVGLGFRRLSIIDLAGGHQPMSDAEETVWFGSEMRPVLASLRQRPEVDPVALNLFLRYRYTPSPLTIFTGIEKLAPGTMVVFENGEARRERWYRYTPVPFPTPKDEDEACEALVGLYRHAMRRHLISDVPVGLLLSGGMR